MKKENMFNDTLEVSSFNGEGYLPLINFESWRVAELRYIDELEPDRIDNMQKHNETDEIFVVLEGDFTLFFGGNGDEIGEIEAIKLEPLKLYNVKKGTFHTHTPEKNCTCLIVENKNTTDDNSPKIKITKEQSNKIVELYNKVNKR
mgnify:FL=1|jgi:mannose-6-phosphate isomerase-like protein (cupin superfamily)